MKGILIIAAAVVATIIWLLRDKLRSKQIPAALRPGNRLPNFTALDEQGNSIESGTLRGSAAVLLFVRGTWCPFCSKQVANLTKYYKAINDAGARLVLITPKPLQTTRRVGDFFQVKFEFWLDESLAIAKSLGLMMESAVPDEYRDEYGEDTIWPTSLVVDADGIIRHTELSRFIADRPNPEKLLEIVKKV
ncbi:MAG: redoxin domain-containing protein [Proteobacteria bacterium]|nr:redoxin domain-containing protein [Pseudomonadota bacterium]